MQTQMYLAEEVCLVLVPWHTEADSGLIPPGSPPPTNQQYLLQTAGNNCPLSTQGETEAQQHTQTGLQCCMQVCSFLAPSVPQLRVTEISVSVSYAAAAGCTKSGAPRVSAAHGGAELRPRWKVEENPGFCS